MINEKIHTREQWFRARGAIGGWFADSRNKNKRDEVNRQWGLYGKRISEIMDRIVPEDDETPF